LVTNVCRNHPILQSKTNLTFLATTHTSPTILNCEFSTRPDSQSPQRLRRVQHNPAAAARPWRQAAQRDRRLLRGAHAQAGGGGKEAEAALGLAEPNGGGRIGSRPLGWHSQVQQDQQDQIGRHQHAQAEHCQVRRRRGEESGVRFDRSVSGH